MDEYVTPLLQELAEHPDVRIARLPFYNDEPKIFQYEASIMVPGGSTLSRGFGSDLVRQHALYKAVCEALERACLFHAAELPLVNRRVAHSPADFIEPRTFQPFAAHQLKSHGYENMKLSQNDQFWWAPGIEASTGRDVWLPAQLVLCPYDYTAEPWLRFPSSNGTALGCTVAEARSRAVLELIERDAFMCWYLAAMPARLLPFKEVEQFEEVNTVRTIYLRYHLELLLLLLPCPWPFPVVAAVIIDHTGVGPSLRMGMKCHPTLQTAINGSVAEAQQMRPWLRDHMEIHGLPSSAMASDILDSWSRALFWARPEAYRQISQLWSGSQSLELKEIDQLEIAHCPVDWNEVWNLIMLTARDIEVDLYLFDLGRDFAKELGVEVVRAVSPQSHPLYMDEKFPYLDSKSLRRALDSFGSRWHSDVTMPPHPFS